MAAFLPKLSCAVALLSLLPGAVLSFDKAQREIEPDAAMDAVPPPPKSSVASRALPWHPEDAPEVSFQDLPPSFSEVWQADALAVQAGKIERVNEKAPDAFLQMLIEKRPDLATLPFVKEDLRWLKNERRTRFAVACKTLHSVRFGQTALGLGTSSQVNRMFESFCDRFAAELKKRNVAPAGAPVAAVTAMLEMDSMEVREGIVSYLGRERSIDSTRAAARMAIFGRTTNYLRSEGIEALKRAPVQDYTDILIEGMSHPWPAVIDNAVDVIVKMKRKDLIPQLIEILERPDPRAPRLIEIKGKKTFVVREMVRVNHNRNCLLCHPPISKAAVACLKATDPDIETLTASIPFITRAPAGSYFENKTNPSVRKSDVLVRIDATYLRPDFSIEMSTEDLGSQRFDLMLRTRAISEQQAGSLNDELRERQSFYHLVADNALRQLTGLVDVEPTAEAWRAALRDAH